MFQESIFAVEFEENTVLNFSGLEGANGQDGQDGSYSDSAPAGENGFQGSKVFCGLDGEKSCEHEIIVISSQEMKNGFLPK